MPWYDANDVIKAASAVEDSIDKANKAFHELFDRAGEEIAKQDEERRQKEEARKAAAAEQAKLKAAEGLGVAAKTGQPEDPEEHQGQR